MSAEVFVRAVLKPDGTLELDEKPNLRPGRVQLIMVPLPELPKDDPFWQRMEAMWAAQKARGHIPRTVEEVEMERQRLRDESEAEIQEAMRVHEECRKTSLQAPHIQDTKE
jgi:hypothetical protein